MSDGGTAAWKAAWKKLVRETIATEKSLPASSGYDDYQRESYDLVKQRDLATSNTKRMLQGFQDSLARIRTNLKNIDNIKAKPETIQSMLESFESRLSAYKNSMGTLFEELNMEETILYKDIEYVANKIDSWNVDSASIAQQEDAKLKQKKQFADQYDKYVEHQKEIGAIDKQLSSLGGRYAGWDSRDHDAFLRIWTQIGVTLTPPSDADSNSSHRIDWTISPQHKTALIKKMLLLIPGKVTEELEEHIDKHIQITSLTAHKKQIILKWKNENSQNGDKVDAKLAEIVNDSLHNTDEKKVGPPVSEEERAAVRARVAKWRSEQKEKEDQEILRKKLDEDVRRQQSLEGLKARQAETKLRLEQWKENEAKIEEELKKSDQVLKNQGLNTSYERDLEDRRNRDLMIAKKRFEDKERKQATLTERETKIKNMDPKLDIVEGVSRDPARLLAQTKASVASKVTPELLDQAERRRASSSAHSSYVPSTGRDLQMGGGRAAASWMKGFQ